MGIPPTAGVLPADGGSFSCRPVVFPDLESVVRFLRLFSVLLWLVNMGLSYLLLNRLQVRDKFARVFVMAAICLLPTYTFVSSVINNDNLLATLCSGLLCLLTYREPSLKRSLALGFLLGLALLTKQSAAVFPLVVVLISLLDGAAGRIKWSSVFWQLSIVTGTAVLIYAPWAFRNWHVYGTFAPELLSTPRKVWPSTPYGLASAVHNLIKTFWAVSGVRNNAGYPFPLPGFFLLFLFCVAGIGSFRVERPDEPLVPGTVRPILNCLFLAVVIEVLLALRFGFLFGMGQGRYLFLLLPVIALLFAARLRMLPVQYLDIHGVGFWVTYAISFLVYSLCCFP